MKNLSNIKSQEQIPLEFSNIETKSELKFGIIGSNHETLDAAKKFILSRNVKTKSFILWGNEASGKSFWLKAWANEFPYSNYYNLKKDILTQNKKQQILFLDNLDKASKKNQLSILKLFNMEQYWHIKIFGSTSITLNAIENLNLRDDLLTRLKQGLIFKLNPLSDNEKKDALKSYIFSFGWLSDKSDNKFDALIDFMLERFPRKLPMLKLILFNTNLYAINNKSPVTIPLIKFIMEKMINEK